MTINIKNQLNSSISTFADRSALRTGNFYSTKSTKFDNVNFCRQISLTDRPGLLWQGHFYSTKQSKTDKSTILALSTFLTRPLLLDKTN